MLRSSLWWWLLFPSPGSLASTLKSALCLQIYLFLSRYRLVRVPLDPHFDCVIVGLNLFAAGVCWFCCRQQLEHVFLRLVFMKRTLRFTSTEGNLKLSIVAGGAAEEQRAELEAQLQLFDMAELIWSLCEILFIDTQPGETHTHTHTAHLESVRDPLHRHAARWDTHTHTHSQVR